MVPELPTEIDGVVLRELTAADAGAYHALLVGSREHLTRCGDYREEAGRSLAEIARRLAQPAGSRRAMAHLHPLPPAPRRPGRLTGMEFFCYHRDRPGSLALRRALVEEHWAYMDRFADGMIARGPTLAADGETPTGSVHIVDLPDPAAARAFAFEEPNYQAGAYRDVMVRRWRNALGRTMWDFPGGRTGGDRYLVIGLGAGEAADVEVPADRAELIVYGPLLSDDGAAWLGTAVLVRAAGPEEARAVLTGDRYDGIEVHHWEFGGRR